MYAIGTLCIRYGTLARTHVDVWEIRPVRFCTLNMLEISFEYVTNTLQYVGIRSHMASGFQNVVHANTTGIG